MPLSPRSAVRKLYRAYFRIRSAPRLVFRCVQNKLRTAAEEEPDLDQSSPDPGFNNFGELGFGVDADEEVEEHA